MSILSSFPQACLNSLTAGLKIMMHHVEVLKRRELIVAWQWTRYQEFDFTRSTQQAISSVDSQLLANTFNHSIDFCFKICWIVNHVKVWMANPSGCSFVVQFTSMFNTFRATWVFLENEFKFNKSWNSFLHVLANLSRVKFFRSNSGSDHVNNLIVAIVSYLNFIPSIRILHSLPLFGVDISRSVHHAAITNYLD